MKSNSELQNEVQDAIKWEPLLNAAEIGVTVKDGVVSLTGIVDTYAKKIAAEHAARSVHGVRAVIEEIKVDFPSSWTKSNIEITDEVLKALAANKSLIDNKIHVKVEEAWVSLEGEVPWNYQKESAKHVVSHLPGVRGVTNNIKIKPSSNEIIDQKGIEDAISRSWSMDDAAIKVKVSGTGVTLSGTVHSLYEKQEAEAIAWKTPRIWKVDNELIVT
ncbi:MAG: BON domain-containing protein [Flavobacteriaceae bacterium]|nr:BON domain-containing protein [Flavobacteriaceae bacterium]